MKEYISCCPYCKSEEITMIGDKEYNDFWSCDNCKKTFGTFKQIEIETK